MAPPSLFLLFTVSLLFLSPSVAGISQKVGVNLGQLGNNLPLPTESAELMKSLKAKIVKIYGADPNILKSLKNTGLQVSIMLPNQLIVNISSSQALADKWILDNVVPFYPDTLIRYLLVGNEILSVADNETQLNLVGAMRRIKSSLDTYRIRKVKVGTPLAIDVLESSSPPSSGAFRADISDRIMKPMLKFLNRTKSFVFLDVYTYFPWVSNPTRIDLNYALLEARNATYTDPGSGLVYTNLFDEIVDSVIFAMTRLGYPNIQIFVAETGWPNGGDYDQIGCNIHNAATYNRNVIKKVTKKPPIGTPARPGIVLPTLLFALYNENQKPGPGTERHFGLLYPNGSNVYPIDLSGKTPSSKIGPLPAPINNEPYKGKIWCVVAKGANMSQVVDEMSDACSQGNKTCDPIRPGGPCFKPDSLIRRASYAFSSNWAQFRKAGRTCFFNGVATQTIIDPSYESCEFPSVTLG